MDTIYESFESKQTLAVGINKITPFLNIISFLIIIVMFIFLIFIITIIS